MSILRNEVFIAPKALDDTIFFSITGYVINTNGLKDTPIINKEGKASGSIRHKDRILAAALKSYKADVCLITETHDQSLKLNKRFSEYNTTESVPFGGKHGTANVINNGTFETLKEFSSQNMAATYIKNEMGIELWVVSAYFPNNKTGCRDTIMEVDKFLSKNTKGKKVILAGDFNTIDTFGRDDCGGPEDPSTHRTGRAEMVLELIYKWRFRDMWSNKENPHRLKERANSSHLTHWNHELTKGVRIDRAYSNFRTDMEISVKTVHHPGSDHKAVVFKIKSKDTSEAINKPREPRIPHKAMEYKEIVDKVKVPFTKLKDFLEDCPKGTETHIFDKWDAAKRKAAKIAMHEWEALLKRRGAKLKQEKRKYNQILKSSLRLKKGSVNRPLLVSMAAEAKLQLEMSIELNNKKIDEATRAKRICNDGKVNKEYFHRKRSAFKKIGNMSISNIKDKPDEPRTDDENIIHKNFVEYYSTLYSDKQIHGKSLNDMIENLDLDLNRDQRDTLEEPITREEIMKAIASLPNGKATGTDGIPYEAYKVMAQEMVGPLLKLASRVSARGYIPNTWKEIIITVLAKEPDSFSTHKYRPISLLNGDYKIFMRIWANRLGPILADIIGHHQRGFIPTRDGRENIITAQLVADWCNAAGETACEMFLDQEKAFDMVSYKSINAVFEKKDWPSVFRRMIASTYTCGTRKARVKINGILSAGTIRIDTGTSQGCPMSPLLFAIIADLFSCTIIKSPNFKGISVAGSVQIKILGYADDTGVLPKDQKSIKTYSRVAEMYAAGTGGRTNVNKSEAVRLGSKIGNSFELPIPTSKSSKYLGVITGKDPRKRAISIKNIEMKCIQRMNLWEERTSSSPLDRVLVGKTMALSTIWYHASVMGGWDSSLHNIEKAMTKFIWRGGFSKVSRDTLTRPKEEGGLKVWDMKAKAAGFKVTWLIKFLNKELNPNLMSVWKHWTKWYMDQTGTLVNIWESHLDHGPAILKTSGNALMAEIQTNWATIMRRNPSVNKDDWVKFLTKDGPPGRDNLYEGRGRVVRPTEIDDVEIIVDWFEWNHKKGRWSKVPLPKGEYHHLQRSSCYKINNPSLFSQDFELVQPRPEDLYIKGTDQERTFVNSKKLKEETRMTIERHGPEFVKDRQNFKIYDALLYRTKRGNPKTNTWNSKYGVEIKNLHKKYNKILAHSPVKGFMWLLCSHALPVGSRMRGPKGNTACPCCNEQETIKHMAFSCTWVKSLREIVMKEWWARSGDQTWTDRHGFQDTFFKEHEGVKAEVFDTLNAITAYEGWKSRNKLLYEETPRPPPLAVANIVWTEMENTLVAKLNKLHKQAKWWAYRETVELATPELVLEKTEGIYKEMNNLSSFLPQRAIPTPMAKLVKPHEVKPANIDAEDFLSLESFPMTYPLKVWKWKLMTVKSIIDGTLDANSESEGEEEERGNSASESGEG